MSFFESSIQLVIAYIVLVALALLIAFFIGFSGFLASIVLFAVFRLIYHFFL